MEYVGENPAATTNLRADLRHFHSMTKPTHVALYERVSTDRQEFAAQHGAIEAYCRRQRWPLKQIYAEKESGSRAKRTALDTLLRDAREGRVDIVVIYRLDRLGRSPLHLYQVLEEFKRLKVRLVSVHDGIDTAGNSPVMEMQMGMLATLANYERELVRERTKAGMAAARKNGAKVGRPPTDQKKVIEVRRLAKAGKKYREIFKRTGVSPASISRILNQSKLSIPRNDRASPPQGNGGHSKAKARSPGDGI